VGRIGSQNLDGPRATLARNTSVFVILCCETQNVSGTEHVFFSQTTLRGFSGYQVWTATRC